MKEKNPESDTSSDDSNGKGHKIGSMKSSARNSSPKSAHVYHKLKERKGHIIKKAKVTSRI